MYPIKLTKIAAQANPNGEGILLTTGTKYAGETNYSLSPELVEGLMADLARLRSNPVSPPPASTAKPSQPAVPNSGASAPSNQVEVRVPKRWMLGNALPSHSMVVFILDPQTDKQAGYAFDVKAAREIAIHFVKNADAITAQAAKMKQE
jgi:hypothetical protein